MTMLEVKDLSLYYGGFQALMDITLRVKRDQIVSIWGPMAQGSQPFSRRYLDF